MMKNNRNFKKIANFATAVLMTACMTAPMTVNFNAMAVNITIDDGSVENASYSAYKILNATDGGNDKYAYTLNDKYTTILQNLTSETEQADIVRYISDLDADGIRTFADSLYAKIKESGLGADQTTTNNQFNDVDQGYYLIVETTLGSTADTYSLVMLDTAGNNNIEVDTKEGTPKVEKKVKETNDTTGAISEWQDGADYDINDVIPFQLTGSLSAKYDNYKEYKYVFHDTLSTGLTLKEDTIKVYALNGTDKVEITNGYELLTTGIATGESFNIVFDDLKKATCTATISSATKIVVEYSATLDTDAQIGSAGNPNTVKLEYSNDPYYTGNADTTSITPEDKVTVFTYTLSVDKVDGSGSALEGAGFTLYKHNGTDYVAIGNEVTGVTTFTFTGLDAGKYKLVESTVPAGYNKAADLEFEVISTYETTSDNPQLTALEVKDGSGNVISGTDKTFNVTVSSGLIETDVENQSGSELPSTGGIGTKVFYLGGGAMVAVAGVLLITKKRMKNSK